MNDITMKLNADNLIKMALQEDISSEDVTTNAVMRNRKAMLWKNIIRSGGN